MHNNIRIIDPVPTRRPLPLMQSIRDAAELNNQERTTFYVSGSPLLGERDRVRASASQSDEFVSIRVHLWFEFSTFLRSSLSLRGPCVEGPHPTTSE